MSGEYNIRDFRNAGGNAGNPESEKSNKTFYTCVVAIPVIAAMVGLGYKPLMEIRTKNADVVQQAQLQMESNTRERNPLYALRQDMNSSDGLIDLNSLGRGAGSTRAPRNPYAKKAMNAKEFLTRVDAESFGFAPLEMETLKYERAVWAMTTCDHYDLRKFYVRQNESKYEKLEAVQDKAKAAKAKIAAAKQAKQAEKAKKHFDKLGKIETKTQAIAFLASGGVGRHMDAIGDFSSMAGMLEGSEAYKVTGRRQRFNTKGCSDVRTIIQSGAMNVKPLSRL